MEKNITCRYMCVCVYMCVYICACVYIYMCVCVYTHIKGFPGDTVVNNHLPANVGDEGLIPGWGRSPGEGNMAICSNIFAWRIPWTEEPGGLQSMGSQRAGHD